MKKYFVLTLLSLLLFACKGNKDKIDTCKIDLNIEIVRLDKYLFNISPDTIAIEQALPALRQKYGNFFELYNQRLINSGNSNNEEYPENLLEFLTAEVVQIAKLEADSVFTDDAVNKLNGKLTEVFKRFKYYFPDKPVPRIYGYISGFGESMSLADSLIGLSFDKYLGYNEEIYDVLSFPRYLSRKMYKEKIPSDAIRAWGIGEYPYTDDIGNNVISKIVYEGKLLYFTKKMCPNDADTTIFGFTEYELEWCKRNEKNMWSLLIEEKLLYSTDYMSIVKLTEEAPYTHLFPPESPGRASNWIGYRIVERYMKRNEDITLKQLMEDKNHQQIFEKAKY